MLLLRGDRCHKESSRTVFPVQSEGQWLVGYLLLGNTSLSVADLRMSVIAQQDVSTRAGLAREYRKSPSRVPPARPVAPRRARPWCPACPAVRTELGISDAGFKSKGGRVGTGAPGLAQLLRHTLCVKEAGGVRRPDSQLPGCGWPGLLLAGLRERGCHCARGHAGAAAANSEGSRLILSSWWVEFSFVT